MRLLFLTVVLFFLSLPAHADEGAEKCTLKNTQFCGTWDGTGKGGGNFIILGHKMSNQTGGEYSCDILDEQTKLEPKYSILKCLYTPPEYRHIEREKSEWLFLLSIKKQHIYGDTFTESLKVETAEHLPCFFTKWGKRKFKEAYDFYKCSYTSRTSYGHKNTLPP